MQKVRLAIPAAVLSTVLVTSLVVGHIPQWPSSTENIYLSSQVYDTRTVNDTYQMRTYMVWDSTRAANMRHVATEYAYRFTDDVHVSNCTLNATSRRETNLENPYFDRDYHSSCGDYLIRAEESEIVAEDAGAITFPSSGVGYWTNLYFMRWACNQSGSVCAWDSSSGSASYDESLSYVIPFADDKWNTVSGQTAHLGSKSFPFVAPPAGAAATEPLVGSAAPPSPMANRLGAAAPAARGAPIASEMFGLQRSASGEALIKPDLSRGLDAYASQARSLATIVAGAGPSRGVITFSRPISGRELDELAATGIQILSVEAVSTPAVDGTRWTVHDRYGTSLQPAMDEVSTEFNVQFLGIVAAEVVVPDGKVLQRTQARADVWLVDLSIEQVGRTRSDLRDLGQNDLYWWLAGWG